MARKYNVRCQFEIELRMRWKFFSVKTDFALTLEDTVAVVQANGRVTVELAQVVQMYCPFDIVLFPFDQQNCTMEFGSWTYSSDRVTFAPLTLDGNTEYLHVCMKIWCPELGGRVVGGQTLHTTGGAKL
jgi:hypothetical protein